jgi:1,2-dihydroxy-3-keto-5-methylthiopentene dioxygenase
MAAIIIADENRRIDDAAQLSAYLAPHGIEYERWPLADRVDPSASPEQILAAYAPEIERLKERGGYTTADVVNVTPETPGLEAMLDRFRSEHTHSENEVRFILKGRGLFFIHPPSGPVFSLQVEEGDLINVPAGTQHWFDLCADRTIRAIRLFQDKSGWTPHYVEQGIHGNFAPVCWGPNYLPAGTQVPTAVKL